MEKPTSTPRELRERFSKPDQETSPVHVNVKEILGIVSTEMSDIITADIAAMLEKSYTKSMEGYIFCLSRIINHDIAWQSIAAAFSQNNEDVPKKYYKQFGRKTQ